MMCPAGVNVADTPETGSKLSPNPRPSAVANMLGVLAGIERLRGVMTRVPIFVGALRVFFVEKAGVRKKDSKKIARSVGAVYATLEAQLAETGNVSGMIDVRVGQ